MFAENQVVTVSNFGEASKTRGVVAARIVSQRSNEIYVVDVGRGMKTIAMNAERILPIRIDQANRKIAKARKLTKRIRKGGDFAKISDLLERLLQMKKKYPFSVTPKQLDELKQRFSHEDELMKILRQIQVENL